MERALDALPTPESGKILAAVSGGADSMALLHALHEHCAHVRITLEAAHVEHGIRGEASRADARRVAAYCGGLSIPLHVRNADAPGYASKRGLGLETAAREVRYALLHEMLMHSGASYCVLAHHRGDQAETLLLNLIRGSGARGLAGMRLQNGWLIRPWLHIPAEQIRAYAREHGLPFADDATNALPDNPRNLLRHRVLPEMARINPSVEAALARAASALAEDDAALAEMARQIVDERLDDASVDARRWQDAPAAVRKRALALVLRSWGGAPEAHHLNTLDAWICERGIPPRRMELPGLRVLLRRGMLSRDEEAAAWNEPK